MSRTIIVIALALICVFSGCSRRFIKAEIQDINTLEPVIEFKSDELFSKPVKISRFWICVSSFYTGKDGKSGPEVILWKIGSDCRNKAEYTRIQYGVKSLTCTSSSDQFTLDWEREYHIWGQADIYNSSASKAGYDSYEVMISGRFTLNKK